MRWLAPLALLVAAPAAAQDDDKPEWVGVWEGKVGTYPVRLCIDQWGEIPARGAYYYLSQLEPLSLREEDGEGGWIEHGPEDPDALWSFKEQSGERLLGKWTKGNRSLAFDLQPIAWTQGEWGEPCGSDAFLLPRLRAVAAQRTEPGDLDGFTYVRHIFVPPAHFRDEIMIESFSFDPVQPGDPRILDFLRAKLPTGAMKDEFVDCVGGAIASVGADGYFDQLLQPVWVDRSFMTVRENTDLYCGGAHPDATYHHLTFDRQNGAEVDLFTWLNDAAREHHPQEPESESYDTVLPALRELILRHDPTDGFALQGENEPDPYDDECREVAESQEFWTLGLSRDGMLFVPSVPHVVMVCAATFRVPWRELAPFLSAEGRAGAARLRAE